MPEDRTPIDHGLAHPQPERGTIPQKFLPVLEEAVEQGVCVCGTSLAKGTPTRKHVCDLIDEHQKVDAIVDRTMRSV